MPYVYDVEGGRWVDDPVGQMPTGLSSTDSASQWVNSQLRAPSGYSSNEVRSGFDVPGVTANSILFGGYGSDDPFGQKNVSQSYLENTLKGISDAAGLQNYDWTPAIAAAAKQHYDQFGQGYGIYTPFQNIIAGIVGNTSDPQIQQVWQSAGPQIEQQLTEAYKGVRDADSARSNQRFNQSIASLAAVAGGALAGGAFAGEAAGGAGATGAGETAALGSGLSTGATGASGITAGTTTGAIGGGALGSGLTAGGSTAGLSGAGAAATGAGALGTGYFGSETAYPVAGGTTAAATGGSVGGAATPSATTAGGTAASGTALSRILDGNASTADYASVLGNVGMAAYGAYASDKQTDAYKELANKYLAMGEPYRGKLAEISADPNQFYNSPGAQQAMKSYNQSITPQTGNPAGSPYAQALGIEALYKQYGAERDRLAGFGGLTAYNSAAPGAASAAIGSQANMYNAIGAGAADLFGARRQRTLAEILQGSY